MKVFPVALASRNNPPFSPTLFLFKLCMASWNSSSPPVVSPETSYCSHWTGTLIASKISLTESATSFPIPSPGTRVTVYLPAYIVSSRERRTPQLCAPPNLDGSYERGSARVECQGSFLTHSSLVNGRSHRSSDGCSLEERYQQDLTKSERLARRPRHESTQWTMSTFTSVSRTKKQGATHGRFGSNASESGGSGSPHA